MSEDDTIKLLRECDAGIKMGVSSIDEILDYVDDLDMKLILKDCKDNHEKLLETIKIILSDYHDDGKSPNMMAKGMSWMKTNMKMGMDSSDHMIADLITDGCNMGVKSLHRYLNQYRGASEQVRDLTTSLISLEEQLAKDLSKYL